MARWTAFIFLSAWSAHLAVGQNCTGSNECTFGQCCRDTTSNAVLSNDPRGFFFGLEEPGSNSGQCVEGGAQAGEICDSQCTCPEGYECYRRISGVCCIPPSCVTIAEANADRDYWRCRPPPPRRRDAASMRRFLVDDPLCSTTPRTAVAP